MRAGNASEKILAAAERLLVEHGVGGLTFEKVARASGVSRGGVLYHFRSKDALVEALVRRFVAEFEGYLETVAARDPEPRGRVSRAYVAASFQPAMSGSERFVQLGSCIMAALNGSPDKLEPLREQNRRWQRRVEADGLDPVEATIVRLAVEGLWLGEAFGTNRLEPGMRRRVIDRLLATCAAGARSWGLAGEATHG
jgi:AcrR family transcriptional regulator